MSKTNFWIDLGVLAAFLVILDPNLTGIAIHEWLSLAFGAAAMVHVLLHWDWIVCVGRKFVKNLLCVSKLKFVVDALLFVAVIVVMLSGLFISRAVLPTLGLEAANNRAWQSLHSLSADASLYLVAVHFALNWGWVTSTFTKIIGAPIAGLFRRRPAPVLAEVQPVNIESDTSSKPF